MFITLPANSECTVTIMSGCSSAISFMKLSCMASAVSSFVCLGLCWLSSYVTFHRSLE